MRNRFARAPTVGDERRLTPVVFGSTG